MPYIEWPHRVQLPDMRTDVESAIWTPWTKQPGDGSMMHVAVLRPAAPVERDNDSPLQAPGVDTLADPYIVSSSSRGGAIKLRDYQQDALTALDTSWRQGHRAPLVVLPTGVGKTIIAAEAMSALFAARGYRSLFVAHRKELLDQTAEKIRLVSPLTRVGIVQAKRNEMGRDITVASIQTIGHRSQARLQRLVDNGPYNMLVIDEAHHAVSPQYRRVINALAEHNPEMLIFGLTATPGRADGTALDEVFDTVAFERNTLDMIQAGWLVPPKGFKVTLDLDLERVDTREGDFVRSQLSKVMNTQHVNRAVVQAWQEYSHNRKTVAFAVDVAHSQALAEMFADAGYTAESVDGKTKARERAAIFKRFRGGETKILVNCEVATEGFDDPSIECVLHARPTQSQGLYIQCTGRGLRLFPGKTECVVIDTVGNSDRHRIVQLASLAGFDPDRGPGGGGRGEGEEGEEDEDTPNVLGADIRGEESDLTRRRPAATRYQWRETSLGWVLQIPRIGYYLVAWQSRAANRCVIRFYDQRPGRRDEPARDVIRDPVDFELAYGLVEAECDRIFNARSRRQGADFQTPHDYGDMPPEMSFVDLDEGTDEELHVPEAWILRDAKWRDRPASAKQTGLLKKLGVKEQTMPGTAGEASDLITIMQTERDLKMRLPPTSKQLGYLRYHGLPMAKTKGAAARAIWQHRKGRQ
jgi:superfamily II DNA or RNA helicase